MIGQGELRAAESARGVSDAAAALLRRVRTNGDAEEAVDRLELQLRAATDAAVQGFDDQTAVTDTDLLATAAAQLTIGLTAFAAESTLDGSSDAAEFAAATANLERLANALERPDPIGEVQGFEQDGTPGDDLRTVASSSLTSMTSAACDVLNAVLDKTLRPLLSKVPDEIVTTVTEWDVPGRLARWGVRAVKRGFELLAMFVNSAAIERIRDQLDSVLGRLGHGEDQAVLTSWAIGADSVRDTAEVPRSATARATAIRDLGELAQRFGKLCELLRRIGLAVVSLGAVLALLHIAGTAIVTAGLVLVIAAVLVLGRDYTGASDLPGPVVGVRLILEGR